MSQPIAVELGRSREWSRFRLTDLREALRELVISTLNDPIDQVSIDFWQDRCDAEIDFLVYSFARLEGASDDPERGVDQLVRDWAQQPLSLTSRGNLIPVYLNTYFFKYIATVELPKIQVAISNPQLSQNQGIDFYITHMLYGVAVEENPGVFFTYEQLPMLSAEKIDALRQLRDELSTSLNQIGVQRLPDLIESLKGPFSQISADDIQKLVPIFKPVFLLMTYYVGSNYRRVHAAVTALASVEMADFRNTFFEKLPSIIQHKGGLRLQVSQEASRAEAKTTAAEPEEQSATPGARIETKAKTGGCYVATAIYGTYDCPELWVLRRFRDQTLSVSMPGRAIIKAYYLISPVVLRLIGRHGRGLFRRPIGEFVGALRGRGYSDAPYVDQV